MGMGNLIFDLDGTLIDSAPSILACMGSVIAEAGYVPLVPLETSLIGPPLKVTLSRITGLREDASLLPLLDAFKDRYDNEALLSTRPFAGMDELLHELNGNGSRLHLATNKRMRPVLSILDLLGWRSRFASIYTQDRIPAGYASKAIMLEHLLRDERISRSDAVYIGDTQEDGMAAASNGLRFIAADWGYGEFGEVLKAPACIRASTPPELLDILRPRSKS